jgi:hypothetical protein
MSDKRYQNLKRTLAIVFFLTLEIALAVGFVQLLKTY